MQKRLKWKTLSKQLEDDLFTWNPRVYDLHQRGNCSSIGSATPGYTTIGAASI
jgi:hypothetical protein